MICSSYRTLHFEILKLKQIFQSNGYPKKFADRCIKMYIDKVFIRHSNICIVPKKELVCVFPFLGRKSLKIKKRLKATKSDFSNHYLKFSTIFISKMCFLRTSGIIYSFKCNSCNAIYYGKTKRHFYVRAAEHMGISHLTNRRLKNVNQSAISDHVLTCDCNINFDDFSILSKNSNNINLLIKESLLISRDKPF